MNLTKRQRVLFLELAVELKESSQRICGYKILKTKQKRLKYFLIYAPKNLNKKTDQMFS